MRFFAIVLTMLGAASVPLCAQEAFEIAVYPYATSHRGEWEFEGHVNYASRGTTAFDGVVAPRQGQVRFAGELTHGLTDHWEMSAYLLAAQVPDLGLEYAGWRLRSRFRAPDRWPLHLGLSIEFETARPAFNESARTLELTPILEQRFGALQLIANPTVERDLAGPEHEFEFEPRLRTAVALNRTLMLGLEYYGSLGENRQWHQVYPTADLRLGDDRSLHLGVGFGTIHAADRLVFKTGLEIPLGGER
jgi:hypothetical protein